MIKELAIFGLFAAMLVAGCKEGPSAQAQPGDKLLRDPMDYNMTDDDFPSVSGGGIGDFDKKGFDRDWKNFIDPNPNP